MPHPSERRLLVLHGLRLKGVASPSVLAELYALDEDDVAKELQVAADEGLVRYREGAVTGWSLTPAGRAIAGALVVAELAAAGVGEVVDAAYRTFLSLNHSMLGACTRWQLRGSSLNDHQDQVYDAAVVDELAGLHEQARPVVEALASSLERFSPYGPRMERAVARVRAGELEWFTKPVIDSYHTLWFELHEDLLATLGRERASEGAS